MSSEKTRIQTPLAKVRGLGSAKEGTHHWLMQRITAVALIPLSVWLVYLLLSLPLLDPDTVKVWFVDHPFQALMLGLFLLLSCYHGKLGLQVIIEDYIHCHVSKNIMLLLNIFGFLILAAMAIMAVIKLHLFEA